MAYSVDRQSLSDKVYKGTYKPAYSMVPDGVPSHVDAFKDAFGAAPDKSKAADELKNAGRVDAGRAEHRVHDRPLRT